MFLKSTSSKAPPLYNEVCDFVLGSRFCSAWSVYFSRPLFGLCAYHLSDYVTAQTALAAPSAAPVACPGAAAPVYPLVAASGWTATPVLGGLTTPRGIVVDTLGNLLVVQRGVGISVHSLDSNGCVKSTKTLVADTTLNHGIDVNILGNKLVARYAFLLRICDFPLNCCSSADTAWSWDYNPRTQAVSNKKTLVTG